MSYLSIVGVVLTVDGGWYAPSIVKQTGAPALEKSNVLLWTGMAETLI